MYVSPKYGSGYDANMAEDTEIIKVLFPCSSDDDELGAMAPPANKVCGVAEYVRRPAAHRSLG